jgi:Zn-finger nucleic acid-binding protein
MRKQPIELPVLELHSDVCRSCALVWLDGGELALLQLGYQATSKFMDAQEFKRRMEKLEADPELKAQFEERLSRLPRAKKPFAGALEEIGDEILESILRRVLDWR